MQSEKEMPGWNAAKTRLKEKITQIAAGSTFALKDQHEELLSRLEAKLGLSRDIIIRIISEM